MVRKRTLGVRALVLGLAALLTLPPAGAAVDGPGEGTGEQAEVSHYAANPLADLPECGPDLGVDADCRPRLGPQGWSIEQQGLAYDYLMEIYEVAHVHPGWGDFGFDHEAGAVQLWFAGELPPGVLDVVERAAKDGVGFEHFSTVYGQAELEDLIDKVYHALTEAGILMDLGGPQPGFTGLQFSFVQYNESRPGSGAADDPEVLEETHRIIREIVGDVPYVIVETEPLVAVAGRQADEAPYSGAARVRMSSGGYCTSGIPMRAGSGTSYRYLLTAAHCARWVNDVAF